mmetsp:Transcript_13040/g.30856  ORF Transcript_13040/g.30856 Transcript_13040/m.30856 type:complete len:205 (+) Transcript_13040:1305-1919(+)
MFHFFQSFFQHGFTLSIFGRRKGSIATLFQGNSSLFAQEGRNSIQLSLLGISSTVLARALEFQADSPFFFRQQSSLFGYFSVHKVLRSIIVGHQPSMPSVQHEMILSFVQISFQGLCRLGILAHDQNGGSKSFALVFGFFLLDFQQNLFQKHPLWILFQYSSQTTDWIWYLGCRFSFLNRVQSFFGFREHDFGGWCQEPHGGIP